jgi:hypothetical protein
MKNLKKKNMWRIWRKRRGKCGEFEKEEDVQENHFKKKKKKKKKT